MEPLNIIIALVGVVLSVLAFVYGRTTASHADGKQDGTIISDLGYLKSGLDDIKKRLDKADDRDRDTITKLACLEQSVTSAHKRIDQLIRKDNHEITV